MRVIYCSETMCLARVKLTSNGQVTGLRPPGVTFAISGFKRGKIGGEGKSRLVELICDDKVGVDWQQTWPMYESLAI